MKWIVKEIAIYNDKAKDASCLCNYQLISLSISGYWMKDSCFKKLRRTTDSKRLIRLTDNQ